jgi:hypothetical protein
MPVGDYDKNAIGHKDYENLAEEIISSEKVSMYPDINMLGDTEDILLHKNEEYIDIGLKSIGIEQQILNPLCYPESM